MTRRAATRFTPADQRRFATLSGDRNPVHLDARVARRVAAGEPIVHGMHLLLRMLDAHFATRRAAPAMTLDATFLNPALVGEPIEIATAGHELSAATTSAVPLVHATIRAARRVAASSGITAARRRASALTITPQAMLLSEIDGAHGVVAAASPRAVARAFPSATRALGADVVASLARLSALVGMECPGRDSLLAAVRLSLTSHDRGRPTNWRATRVDRRFGLVRIDISGGGIHGSVDAFVRPQPVAPPTFDEASQRVHGNEFAGQRALVVGGSRGLGAACVLLLAAGGAVPVVTYATGEAEARMLRRRAAERGARIETLRLDVLSPDARAVVTRAAKRFSVTHVYYFPTPRIFARRPDTSFDARLFARFASTYLDAFAVTCAAAQRAGSPLDVFYPSSEAVADPPPALTEYAAAKAAGECLCEALERSTVGLRVFVSRLPRVATDQTASILAAPAASPLDVMLPIVREMHRRGQERRA